MAGATTSDEWTDLLVSIGIPASNAKTYASDFVKNDLTQCDIVDLDKATLRESINITSLGHQLKILRLGKQEETTVSSSNLRDADSTSNNEHKQTYKSPSAAASVKLPNITSHMTHPQFRKIMVDWTVYKSITSIPSTNLTAHLYSACESSVQNSIINTAPNFLE